MQQAASGAFEHYNATQLGAALSIVNKFDEHFFLKSKQLTARNEEAKMGQSFYRKDGLDFLAFSYAEGFSKLNIRVCTRVEKIE